MIGLFARDRSLPRRLLGEVVPLGVGFVVGSFGAPFLGAVGGVLLGLLVATGVSGVLVKVRRRPKARRIYRLLLAAHVVFWTVAGVVTSTPSRGLGAGAAGEPRAVASAWVGASTFRAGVGEAFFKLPERTTLAGWGTRARRVALPAFGGFGVVGRCSQDVMGAPAPGEAPRVPMLRRPEAPGERLGARALVLVPDDGGRPLGIVRLDLVALDGRLRAAVAARVAEHGFGEETLLLAATHTHSCPGGVLSPRLAAVAGSDHLDTEVLGAVADAAVAALDIARNAARPARIAFPRARDRGSDGRPLLALNRCLEDDTIDDRVMALRVDDEVTGRPIACVLHYAVQPVMLRSRHLAFARDLAGALEDALTDALPGRPPVLFLNGAMGDVAPRTVHPGGAEGAALLAHRFAAAVADDLAAGPAYARLRLGAATRNARLAEPYAFASLGSRAAFERHVVSSRWGADAPAVLANLIVLPVNVAIWSLGLPEVRVGFTFDGSVGAMATLAAGVGSDPHPVGALVFEARGEGALSAPVRSLWLWQGAIPTTGAGRAWRAAVEAHTGLTPFVLSCTNDALGYATTREEYVGRWVYEAQSTLHGPSTAEDLVASLLEALDAAEAVLGDPSGRLATPERPR